MGMHSNLCLANSPVNIFKTILGSFTYPFFFSDAYSSVRIYPLSRYLSFLLQESGYLHLQATKPDTIGIALGDSPAGLAAYILEKFSTWTKASWISAPDGGLNLGAESITNLDGGHLIPLPTLLDNIMINYVTRSITTSMRIFSENLSPAHLNLNLDSIPVTTVPVSCAQFAEEIFHTPEFAIRSKFSRLVRLSRYNRGGHFIAMEEPMLLAEDIYAGVMLMEAEHEKNKY
ncbi:hypothetical protein J437_LFUL008258 [Ladona fulva]|uniref:Epoxide hydrolase n=1 Tax=Ladona fulva TaxID=123851 RepID=A0A8K0K8L3_LADFU|nr:hypothetical protein J437_LFUL008258 [Ladona fulva]